MTMEERVIELETKLAYLEDTVQKLDDVIVDQQRRLGLLEDQNKRLKAQLKTLTDAGGQAYTLEEEVPPHY